MSETTMQTENNLPRRDEASCIEIHGPNLNQRSIYYEGYRYSTSKTTETCLYLYCPEKCAGKAQYKINEKEFKLTRAHFPEHPSDEDLIQLSEFLDALKAERKRSMAKNADVYKAVAKRFPTRIVSRAPLAKLRRTLDAMKTLPPLPQTFTEAEKIILDAAYGQHFSIAIDGREEIFFQQKVTANEDAALIFALTRPREILREKKLMLLDATFSCVPPVPFSRQLFTTHVIHHEASIPIQYSLMTAKTRNLYTAILNWQKDWAPQFEPEESMSDLEEAIQLSISTVYPRCKIKSCLFHGKQCHVRAILRLGLSAHTSNPFCWRIVQLCMALHYTPPDVILPAFEFILREAHRMSIYEIMKPYLDYVKHQWLEQVGPEVMSIYRCVHRTNNYVESYHAAAAQMLKTKHPGFYDFLGWLKELAFASVIDIEAAENNMPIRQRSRLMYSINNETICDNYRKLESGRFTVTEFLVEMCKFSGRPSNFVHGDVITDEDILPSLPPAENRSTEMAPSLFHISPHLRPVSQEQPPSSQPIVSVQQPGTEDVPDEIVSDLSDNLQDPVLAAATNENDTITRIAFLERQLAQLRGQENSIPPPVRRRRGRPRTRPYNVAPRPRGRPRNQPRLEPIRNIPRPQNLPEVQSPASVSRSEVDQMSDVFELPQEVPFMDLENVDIPGIEDRLRGPALLPNTDTTVEETASNLTTPESAAVEPTPAQMLQEPDNQLAITRTANILRPDSDDDDDFLPTNVRRSARGRNRGGRRARGGRGHEQRQEIETSDEDGETRDWYAWFRDREPHFQNVADPIHPNFEDMPVRPIFWANPPREDLQVEAGEGDPTCSCCLINIPRWAGNRCGHVRFCRPCSESYVEHNNRACPLCNQQIDHFLYIHLNS